MEPVSEDTIKEVGWREMPLFNGRQWLIAIGAYSFLFVSVVLLTTPIIVTTKTTALEQELVEKKKDLELRASFTAETENQTWLILYPGQSQRNDDSRAKKVTSRHWHRMQVPCQSRWHNWSG